VFFGAHVIFDQVFMKGGSYWYRSVMIILSERINYRPTPAAFQ